LLLMKMKSIAVLAVLVACACANPFSRFLPHMKELGRRGQVFIPAPLPCSFGIHVEDVYIVETEGEVASETTWSDIVVDGNTMHSTTVSYSSDGNTTRTEKAIRGDQAYNQDETTYYPVYNASSKSDSCTTQNLEKADAEEQIAQSLAAFTREYPYNNVTDSNYYGVPCKKYFYNDEGKFANTTIIVYADSDDFIIGLAMEMVMANRTFVTTSFMNISYAFSVSMSAFSIDGNVFPNCQDAAYTDATEQCGIYSSGASSDSSHKSDSSFFPSSTSSSSSSHHPKPVPKSSGDSSADFASKTQATAFVVLLAIAVAVAALL